MSSRKCANCLNNNLTRTPTVIESTVDSAPERRDQPPVLGGIEPGGWDRDVHGIGEFPRRLALGANALGPAQRHHGGHKQQHDTASVHGAIPP